MIASELYFNHYKPLQKPLTRLRPQQLNHFLRYALGKHIPTYLFPYCTLLQSPGGSLNRSPLLHTTSHSTQLLPRLEKQENKCELKYCSKTFSYPDSHNEYLLKEKQGAKTFSHLLHRLNKC